MNEIFYYPPGHKVKTMEYKLTEKQEKNNYCTQKYTTPITNNSKKNTPELAHLFTTQARRHVINAKNRVGNQIFCLRKLSVRSTRELKKQLGQLKSSFLRLFLICAFLKILDWFWEPVTKQSTRMLRII